MTEKGDDNGKEAEGDGNRSSGSGNKPESSGSETSGVDPKLAEFVRQTVNDALGKSGAKAKPEKPASDDGAGEGAPQSSSWARRIESLAESAVREAAERIQAEKAHEESHKKIEKVAEGLPKEKPRIPLLRRALWGSDE